MGETPVLTRDPTGETGREPRLPGRAPALPGCARVTGDERRRFGDEFGSTGQAPALSGMSAGRRGGTRRKEADGPSPFQ